jgi:uncharacterized protein with HEPN domain
MSLEKFLRSSITQSAVMMRLALIGETSKNISPKIKKQIDLPWKEIAGFRDKAVHDYFSMDLKVVFLTIREDLSVLKKEVKVFLKKRV